MLSWGCAANRPSPAAQQAQAPLSVSQMQQIAHEAYLAEKAGDLPDARDKYMTIIRDAGFPALTSATQHSIVHAAGAIDNELEDWAGARSLLLRASAMQERTGNDFWSLMVANEHLRDLRGEMQAMTELARVDPQMFAKATPGSVFIAARESIALNDPELRFHFLAAVVDAGYVRFDGEPSSWLQRELAVAAIERGDVARAEQTWLHVQDARRLPDLLDDRRFDFIVARHPGAFDIGRMGTEQLQRLRRRVAQKPRSLAVLLSLASATGGMGNVREMLALTDEALARIAASKTSPYDDLDRELGTLRDTRADALWELGRHEDALDELERASRVPFRGRPNVAERLNLAQRYCDLGRPQKALSTLDDLVENGDRTKYGSMDMALSRFRAAVQVGDSEAAAAALEYLRSHKVESPAAFVDALLQSERLDEAAQQLVADLEDPWLRADALHWVQHFPDIAPLTPVLQQRQANWATIEAREDVKAAIGRVGRMGKYPLVQF
jgi:tetratricopeptide (TPR) repeat protein